MKCSSIPLPLLSSSVAIWVFLFLSVFAYCIIEPTKDLHELTELELANGASPEAAAAAENICIFIIAYTLLNENKSMSFISSAFFHPIREFLYSHEGCFYRQLLQGRT